MNITTEDQNWLKRLTLYWQKPIDWYDRFKQRQEGNMAPIRTACSWKQSVIGDSLEPVLWFGELNIRYQDGVWNLILIHKDPLQGNYFHYWIEEKVWETSVSEEMAREHAEELYYRYDNAIVMAHAWYGHYLVESNNTFTCFCSSDDSPVQTENYDANLSNWKEKIERLHQERIEELLDSDTLIENGIVRRWY